MASKSLSPKALKAANASTAPKLSPVKVVKSTTAPKKQSEKKTDTTKLDMQGPGVGVEEISAALEAAKIAADPTLGSVVNSSTKPQPSSKEAPRAKPYPSAPKQGALPNTAREPSMVGEVPAKSPGKTPTPAVRIFQIYYEPWQRELLDPNFVALDNGKTTSELMEFAVFERLVKSDYVKDATLWGALSWRFTERTGMTGAELINAIAAQPGKDLYYCDPVPVNEALFHNFWLQGETSHPQFLALCQAIFKVTGLPESELTGLQSSDQFSASNYFVGTSRFWQTYIAWVNQVLSAANKKLPPNVRDLMHSKLADDRDLHKGATYVPFIVERLLPVFLKTAGKDLAAFKIALPKRDGELNVHLKLLREMKDVAHRTKSAWLAACWVNYRNLYLMQVNGKEWCDKYLRNITPTEITFS